MFCRGNSVFGDDCLWVIIIIAIILIWLFSCNGGCCNDNNGIGGGNICGC